MPMRLVQSGARDPKGKYVPADVPGRRIRGRVDRSGGKLCNPNHVGRRTQHRYLRVWLLEKFVRVRSVCVHNFPGYRRMKIFFLLSLTHGTITVSIIFGVMMMKSV